MWHCVIVSRDKPDSCGPKGIAREDTSSLDTSWYHVQNLEVESSTFAMAPLHSFKVQVGVIYHPLIARVVEDFFARTCSFGEMGCSIILQTVWPHWGVLTVIVSSWFVWGSRPWAESGRSVFPAQAHKKRVSGVDVAREPLGNQNLKVCARLLRQNGWKSKSLQTGRFKAFGRWHRQATTVKTFFGVRIASHMAGPWQGIQW